MNQTNSETIARLEVGETLVVPLVEESVVVEKRWAETGGVRVLKTVVEREETVDVPLMQEAVEVQRVPVNRQIAEPVGVRYEGDTMIVPIFEEVLVVEKRLVLKEELHITRRQTETHSPQTVTLRTEQTQVERFAAQDAFGHSPRTETTPTTGQER